MADVAASSSTVSFKKYDVFLNFRGEDVRKSFISHLYKALSENNIETFKDDAKLEIGDEISPSLLRAIEASRLFLVVFSKHYATSSWCLDELVHILKCNRENTYCIIPVYFEVDPSDVRKQKGSYEAAFVELAERGFKIEKRSNWKKALTTASNLAGLPPQATSDDSKLVDKIVKVARRKLNRLSPVSNDFNNLVGIHDCIEKIQSLLCNRIPKMGIIGIWGMCGIGKTTLASVVYNRLFSQFERSAYLENVSDEESIHLRSKLLAGLLEKEYKAPYLELIYSKRKLKGKKVLIVLDDVSDSEHFHNLISKVSLDREFGDESRIIITTTDWQVVKSIKAFEIYKVEELKDSEAFKLFCFNAFDKSFCPMEDYEEMSRTVVDKYAKGIPLALQVLGSDLYSKCKEDWINYLEKIERILPQKIQQKLEVSFLRLDRMNKEIFLNIACFFKGEERDFVERILDGCNLSRLGIKDLIDKSLITIGQQNQVWMHDLIQKMGQEIVCREELGKRSRLWNAEEIYELVAINKGTADVEGIFLDTSKLKNQLDLSPTVFSNMRKLKFLKIHNSAGSNNENFKVKRLKSLPRSLVYFHWHGYPLKYLPPNFSPDNLVELSMPWGRFEKLWNADQNLEKLRRIDLSNCECLTQVPDLSKASNVESINLECCRSLRQVPPGFHNLHKLTSLNLKGCSSLKQLSVLPTNIKFLNLQRCTGLESIPTNIYELRSLCKLDLSGCSNLKTLPYIPSSMEPTLNLIELILDRTAISKLPRYIGKLSSIKTLSLVMCENLVSLPKSISELHCLQSLSLRCCPKLERLPALPRSLPSVDAPGCTSLKTVFRSKAVAENCIHQNGGTFTFCDCLNLDFKSQSNIMADALLRIMHMARVKSNSGGGQGMTQICWPGNKIPSWFKPNTWENSSLTIGLPLQRSDNQTFLGFYFCVVVDFKDCNLHDGDLKIICETSFTLPDGFSVARRWSWIWHCQYRDESATVNLPHVFLFYKNMSPTELDLEDHDKSVNVTFKFKPEHSNGRVNWRNITVERCGIRFRYAHDLEKPVVLCEEDEEQNEIETADSEDEDEDENEPHLQQNGSSHLEENGDNGYSIWEEFYETFNLHERSSGSVNAETSGLSATSQSAAVQTLPLTSESAVVHTLPPERSGLSVTSQSAAVQTTPSPRIRAVEQLYEELRNQNTRFFQVQSQLGMTPSRLLELLSESAKRTVQKPNQMAAELHFE